MAGGPRALGAASVRRGSFHRGRGTGVLHRAGAPTRPRTRANSARGLSRGAPAASEGAAGGCRGATVRGRGRGQLHRARGGAPDGPRALGLPCHACMVRGAWPRPPRQRRLCPAAARGAARSGPTVARVRGGEQPPRKSRNCGARPCSPGARGRQHGQRHQRRGGGASEWGLLHVGRGRVRLLRKRGGALLRCLRPGSSPGGGGG